MLNTTTDSDMQLTLNADRRSSARLAIAAAIDHADEAAKPVSERDSLGAMKAAVARLDRVGVAR